MSAVEPNTARTDAPRPATVVVTGASGWLGQNLVRALAHERQRVRCLVPADNEAPLLEVVGPTVEVVVGDVRDPAALDRVFEGVGPASVFHAAAVIHPGQCEQQPPAVPVGVLDGQRAGARRVGAQHGARREPHLRGVGPNLDADLAAYTVWAPDAPDH